MTPVSNYGEFGLIDHLTKNFPIHHEIKTMKGVGDDCAVLSIPNSDFQVVSSDMYVEGIHFDLRYYPATHLGYKIVTASISDVYAMNCLATQITVSIAISSKISVEFLEEFYHGISIACEKYNIDLVGGDTTSSNLGMIISVTAMGSGLPKNISYRSGAKEGDVLVVTGDLGASYMGLQILEREKKVFLAHPEAGLQLSGYEYILQRHLRPEARKDIVEMLEAFQIVPSSMIDISDGLSSEAIHLAKSSNVGICIYEEKIPLDDLTKDTAKMFNLDGTLAAMNGGEDFELLFTCSLEEYEKIKSFPDFTSIGYISPKEEGMRMLAKSGNRYELKAQGWNHFNEEVKE